MWFHNVAMTIARKTHLDTLAVSILLVCCLFWGFQQVLVKATVAEVAPVYQAFLRFLLGTLCLLAWCRWRGIDLGRAAEPPGVWKAGLLAGLLFAAEFACLFIGLQYTSASRLTVFLYCSPFWVALILPRLVPGERLRGVQWLGLGCAFVGVLLALGDGWRGNTSASQAWLGDALALLAGLLWGLTTVVLRASPLAKAVPAKQLLYQMGVSTALLPFLSLALGESWQWQFSGFAWGSLLIQGLIGAFVSYQAWMWLLSRYPATRVSAFVFLTPVFTLMIGAAWLGEPITLALLAALALVAAGMLLVNRR